MGRDALSIYAPQRGSFSVRYCIHFADGAGAIIRFPISACLRYAEEKLFVMRHISDNTTVSVPSSFHQGMKESFKSLGGLGALISWNGSRMTTILLPS